MGNRESAEEIEMAAQAWVVRLDREDDQPDSLRELEAWLGQDPRREGAFLRAQAIWARLDRAALAEGRMHEPSSPSRRRALVGRGAAAVAAASAGAWFAFGGLHVETARGEVRHVPLPDGSGLDLNTKSRISVAMEPSRRTMRLELGEAWFQVKMDPASPFVVEAGSARIRAIGTAFAVRRYEDSVEVLVTEGVVSAWLLGREQSAIRLEAGDKGRLVSEGVASRIASGPAEIDRRLAWRSGTIDLAGESLEQAVSEFNRYNRRKLVIGRGASAAQKFYGLFRMDDPEGFARSVHSSSGVPIEIQNDRIIIGEGLPEDS